MKCAYCNQGYCKCGANDYTGNARKSFPSFEATETSNSKESEIEHDDTDNINADKREKEIRRWIEWKNRRVNISLFFQVSGSLIIIGSLILGFTELVNLSIMKSASYVGLFLFTGGLYLGSHYENLEYKR